MTKYGFQWSYKNNGTPLTYFLFSDNIKRGGYKMCHFNCIPYSLLRTVINKFYTKILDVFMVGGDIYNFSRAQRDILVLRLRLRIFYFYHKQ